MLVNPDLIRLDLLALLEQVDDQIKEAQDEAEKIGVAPAKLRDANGTMVMSPLLLAKVQALGALVQLNNIPD